MGVMRGYSEETARGHLTQRFSRGVQRRGWEEGQAMPPGEVLAELSRAERGDRGHQHQRWGCECPDDLPEPAIADIAAGLSLMGGVRDRLEQQELLLIEGARARGVSWDQVAVNLGLGSRQAAEQRCRRLRERWPDAPHPRPSRVEEGEVTVPPPGWLRAEHPPPFTGWPADRWERLTLAGKLAVVTAGITSPAEWDALPAAARAG